MASFDIGALTLTILTSFIPRTEEVIDDLTFLNGKGEKINLLEGLDLAVLHEATELGDGNPLFLLLFASATTPTTAPTATSATATSARVIEKMGDF